MAATPIYNWPYSGPSDPPDGPAQQGALALAIEADVDRIDGEIADLKELLAGYSGTQTGNATISAGAQLIISSVSIPDPGYAYYIFVDGAFGWNVVAATIAGRLCEGAITLDSAVYNVQRIIAGYQPSDSIGAGFTQGTIVVPHKRTDAVTGGHTVRLIARNTTSPAADITFPAAMADFGFNVRIAPA
jgi:hypothetical protein